MTKELNELVNNILDSEEPRDYVMMWQENDYTMYSDFGCPLTLNQEGYEEFRKDIMSLFEDDVVIAIYKHIIGGGMELIWPKKL